MDFQDVSQWQNNKLDRRYNSRMGWSDLSICLSGPVVEDLKQHFAQRWNFIFQAKYDAKNEKHRYSSLHPLESRAGIIGHGAHQQVTPGAESNVEPTYTETIRDTVLGRLEDARDQFSGQIANPFTSHHGTFGHHGSTNGTPIQLVRSCARWSNGSPVEHSIANAYIETIRNSKHFIYIENQFFITATDDKQKPIKNKIGAAITERIIRAVSHFTPTASCKLH